MAKIKVLVRGEEVKEEKELEKKIKKLNKEDKEKLKVFLQGMEFANS